MLPFKMLVFSTQVHVSLISQNGGVTLPVTVRLQRRDDRFYSSAWRVLIRNHQLTNLDRTQARLALENILHLREKLLILEPQVAIGQRFEYKKITKKKMDMNINEQAHDY
jgi:hypothetical protein